VDLAHFLPVGRFDESHSPSAAKNVMPWGSW
jgi:hypothetical protein